MLASFDTPDSSVSCARRDATTVAPQALTMMNSEFMLAQSKRAAKKAEGTPDAIGALWQQTLQREPTPKERDQSKSIPLAHLALVLFNSNEFLHPD